MAELPFFSLVAPDIRIRMGDGRGIEARQMVIAELLTGKADQEVQAIAAEMLAAPPKAAGAPAHAPMRWLEIYSEFRDAVDRGMKRTHAVAATASAMLVSEKHVRNCVKFYEDMESSCRE